MRYVLVVILLTGCQSPFAPSEVYDGRRSMEPLAHWPSLYARVEACWGKRGDFAAIRWHTADRIRLGGSKRANATIRGDEITIVRGWLDEDQTVMHEMSHHVSRLGNVIHYGGNRALCDDAP